MFKMRTMTLALIAGLAISTPLRAADVPAVKAINNAISPNSFFSGKYPYDNSGFFVGAYTEGGGGSVSANVPGVGPASLTTTTAAIGLTAGYAFTRKGSAVALTLEGDVCATNFNGNNSGLSLSGPLCFEQRVMVFAPWQSIASYFPSIPNPFGNLPQPALPPGVSPVGGLQMGIGVGAYEKDMTLAFLGAGSNKVWSVDPEIVFMSMQPLSDGKALRAWVKTDFPDKGTIFGAKGVTAVRGPNIRAGFGVAF